MKLLGITIEYELKSRTHINELCKKASYKLHALQKIRVYSSVDKARLLANAFIDNRFYYAFYQFYYTPLIWMFAGKTLIN